MDYNSKLVEFGSLNVNAALEGAVKLADAKSPPEFFQILTGLAREQFERLSEQIEELSALAPLTEGRGADKTDLDLLGVVGPTYRATPATGHVALSASRRARLRVQPKAAAQRAARERRARLVRHRLLDHDARLRGFAPGRIRGS